MAYYRVNPDTVSESGLKFRNAPSFDPSTYIGLLKAGDVVESTGQPQNAPPVVWLPVRIVSAVNIAAGTAGFTALSYEGDQYLVPAGGPKPASPLLDATARVAALMNLPVLLLKAFMGVEGADASDRDGVLQVIPSTRPGVIARITRTRKLAALGMSDDPAISDDDLNTRFSQAYQAPNLVVQVMTGAQYILEQLDRFNGYVALAGLAYNAGPGTARSVINAFGGDPFVAALQYHKHIGSGGNEVTVQPGIDQVDPATGAHWTRYPVTANDTGKEIFQYLYMRQVPGRNYGLLDFIFQPSLLASRGLYQDEVPPGDDTSSQALVVADSQFRLVAGQSTGMFTTTALSQRDAQWKDAILGFGDASTTIGSDGCTLTCLTMLANGFGFQETPATLNTKLKALGAGRGFSGPLIVWSGLPAVFPSIPLQKFELCTDVPAPMADIDAALDRGQPVIVEVDQSPQPDFQNHWVLIYARRNGDYLIHDPWPVPAEASASLEQRYGFAGLAAQVINAVAIYGGKASLPQPVSSPFYVAVNDDPGIAAAGGLALRDAPVTGNVKMRLPAGTLLEVREALDGALAKIGQADQWLRVCNSEGVPGFVAGWLVHASAAHGFAAAFAPADAVLRPRPEKPATEPLQPPLRHTTVLAVLINRPKPPHKAAGRKTSRKRSKNIRKTERLVPLRARPSRGKALASLKPGSRLLVAEPASVALAKIGRKSQWLNVYDRKGREGYIRADAVHAAPVRKQAAISQRQEKRGRKPVTPARSLVATADSGDVFPLVEVVEDPDITAVGGLALRDAPINGNVKLRLAAGEQLEIRESADTGLAKVGQVGQWLRVCNSEGVPGYVAAWYVKLVEATPPTTNTPVVPPVVAPEVVAQKVVVARADAPLLNLPQPGASSEWSVTAGTPLRVIESGDWAGKLGQADRFVQVQSYAFKNGYVQGSLVSAPDGVDHRVMAQDARVPVGVGSWLYGLHDSFDRNLFQGTGKAGWVLITERITSGAGNTAYADWANADFGVIVRLNNDYGGTGTIPAPSQYDSFASQCAQWVRNSSGSHIWVIGNEMNNPREWPGEGQNPALKITPELYAQCFNKVRAAIRLVQPDAMVIPGALDCFQGPQQSCLDWFRSMLAAIDELDGFALHCYTHGQTPNLVTDLGRFGSDPLRWQYYQFRAYTTFLDVIPARWRNRPVFITETNPYGDLPWSGGQNGWVQAAYAEINRWNQQPLAQQIRALILYRWSRDDAFSITDKPAVQADLRTTINSTDYRWRW